MTIWYINDLALTNTMVIARKINTPWASAIHDVYGEKAVVINPNIKAQQIVLDMSLRRSGRFGMETSIRAELEDSPSIYVESTEEYIYKDKKFCWLVPSGMNVTDGGAEQPLKCIVSGLVDERTIHSCDFLTNWTGTSLTSNTDTRFGANSIKDTASTNVDHFTTYAPPSALDLSNASQLCYWVKSSQASTWFDTFRMEILTDSDFSAWNATTFSADTWSYQTCDLTLPDATSGTIATNNITSVRLRTNPPSATLYDVYLAWIWVE